MILRKPGLRNYPYHYKCYLHFVVSQSDSGTASPVRDERPILGLRPANERRRYFVTTSLIGWAQA